MAIHIQEENILIPDLQNIEHENLEEKLVLIIKSNAKALRRLIASCEKAKRDLSVITQYIVDIDALMDGEELNVVIARSKFQDLCMDLFKKYIPLENVKKDSKISKSQIDEVVLLIRSTLVPKIQKMAQEFFKEKNKKKY